MELQNIREQLLIWRINPKPEHNVYIDLFIEILDHIIALEQKILKDEV